MILKTAANYNDEGGYIEAWKNSDGTTEVKLIPKSGGGDEGKQGLKSISISPEITTTPALDSVYPIYYEDLTDEQKQEGVSISVTVPSGSLPTEEMTFTATPTSDWYIVDIAGGAPIIGEKGAPVSIAATPFRNKVSVSYVCTDKPGDEEGANHFGLHIVITEE